MSEALPSAGPALPDHTPGWTLPAPYYLSADVFTAELDSVFRAGWLFAGHSCEVRAAGDYLLFDLGDESLVVVRAEDGALHAHHNVCRHRGSRLCEQPRGTMRVLVCPYHQWTYGLDGTLRAARLMGPAFVTDGHRLAPAAVREVAGLVFVSLADDPPSFAAPAAAIAPQLTPHRLDHARVAHRATYRVQANWKTLVENNRECYHCRANHPEFLESNFDFGSHGDPRRSATYDALLAAAYERWAADGLAPTEISFPGGAWYRVARLPLRAGFATETRSGAAAAPRMGSVGDDPGSLRLIGLPTFWAHANLDYAVTTRLTPVSAAVTDVDVTFLVSADAADADVDLDALTAVWTQTSEQDWALCEANYAGIRSRAYRPGPLSSVVEASVRHFHEWYLVALSGRPPG